MSLVLFAFPRTTHASTLTIQPGSADGKDSWLEYLSSNNHGDESTVQVYASGSAGGHFGLVAFPLDDIPDGSTIHSATLTLYGEYWIPGPNAIRLNRVTSSWEEGTVQWNAMPSVDTSGTYQTDVAITGATLSFDITNLVRDWHSGSVSNHGIRFGYTTFSSLQAYNFTSSEGAISANRPKLVVDYTASGGDDGGGTPDPSPSPSPQPTPSPSVSNDEPDEVATNPSPSANSTKTTPKASPSPKAKTIKEELLPSPEGTPTSVPTPEGVETSPTPATIRAEKPTVEIVTTKKIYAEGEDIIGYVIVANQTTGPARFAFSSSKQADYRITGSTNYQWTKGRIFGPQNTRISILPGHRHGWRFVHTAKRAKLQPGTYTVTGEVTGTGIASTDIIIH